MTPGAPFRLEEFAGGPPACCPTDIEHVAGSNGFVVDERRFLCRETGLQHTAADVDAAGHGSAAAECPAAYGDRARM